MAFLTAMESRVVGNGVDLGDMSKTFVAEGSIGPSDATVINDTGRKFTQGLMSGTYKSEGFLSIESVASLADGSWDMIRRALGQNTVVIAAPVGDAIGYPAVGMRVGSTKAAVMPTLGETEGYSIDGEAQNGFDMGVVLQPWAAKTAAYNGPAHDAGASSALGAVAYISWGEFAGTDAIVKVQHCTTEGGTYVDAATFTTVAAARGGERVEIAAGTLNRWTRVIISSGTFTNLQLMVMLARK